ncbi:MAG: hypothetical protein DMF78_10315 [Acidobacteria bacterium]|nr:MAG: hypothetical protein DMF78_10315 [Acidobacteriota bacterium]
MTRAVAVLAFVIVAVAARGDEVFVRGGGRVSGHVIAYGPDSIVVDVGPGQIGLPVSYVERIVPGTTPQAVYRERAARLAPGDAAGWVALGQWAMEQDLVTKGRAAFEHVLGIDPSNAAAHLALGHVRVGDQWMTQDESHRARGLVSYQGRWMTPDDRRALLDERLAAAEEERMRLEAEARVREAEARARLAEAEAERAEAELNRSAAPAPAFGDTGFGYPAFGYPAFGYPSFVVGGYSPWFAVHSRAHFRRGCEFGNCGSAFAPRFVHPMRTPVIVPPVRHPGRAPGRR